MKGRNFFLVLIIIFASGLTNHSQSANKLYQDRMQERGSSMSLCVASVYSIF